MTRTAPPPAPPTAPSPDQTGLSASAPALLPAPALPPSPPRDRRGRARLILELLDHYIPAPAIPLEHCSPFQLLVAVILSAQCTDARVNQVTPALFARAPDARAMAQLRPGQIRPFIRTCGLGGPKARAIAALSRILVEEYGGEVPRELERLEALPGVGHKTASVVLAQAFHEPAFPVDTHIHRLAGRWQLSRARSVEEVERDLKQLFPRERWSMLHLQMIYFGRQHCPAKAHRPSACPICAWAMSRARALREERQGVSKPTLRKPRRRRRAAPSAAKRPTRPTRPAQRAKRPAKRP